MSLTYEICLSYLVWTSDSSARATFLTGIVVGVYDATVEDQKCHNETLSKNKWFHIHNIERYYRFHILMFH